MSKELEILVSTAFKDFGDESISAWSPAEGNTLKFGRKMNTNVVAASAELFHLARNEADMAVTVAPVNESQFHGVLQPRFLLSAAWITKRLIQFVLALSYVYNDSDHVS